MPRTARLLLAVVSCLAAPPAMAQEWLYSGVFAPRGKDHATVSAKRWPDFHKEWQAQEKKGYRLVDFEVMDGSDPFFFGVFAPGSYKPAALLGVSWKEFEAFWGEMNGKGYRLIDLETWRKGNQRVYGGVFRPGNFKAAGWVAESWKDFHAKWQEFEKSGLRLADVETWTEGGKRWYAGVFRAGGYAPAALVGVTWADFKGGRTRLEKKGFNLLDLERFESGGEARYIGLFGKTGKARKLWVNGPPSAFGEKKAAWAKAGYQPIDLEVSWRLGQGKPANPPPAGKPVALTFSKNTVKEPVTGLMFPADMPAIRFPGGFEGCSAEDKQTIRRAWALAHYYVWRSDQVMDWLSRNSRLRKAAWSHGYDANYKQNGYRNFSPRAWFGPYDGSRFSVVEAGVEKAWGERFRGRTFTVKCRVKAVTAGEHPCYVDNPGGSGRPSANHILLGTINFCHGFFEPGPFSTRESDFQRATTVVHEVFHHLGLKNGAVVMDTHVHCDGGRCRTQKMYGRERAAHLAHVKGVASGHYKRAIRNNDNYALFAYMLGRKVYEEKNGRLDQFPAQGFAYN